MWGGGGREGKERENETKRERADPWGWGGQARYNRMTVAISGRAVSARTEMTSAGRTF